MLADGFSRGSSAGRNGQQNFGDVWSGTREGATDPGLAFCNPAKEFKNLLYKQETYRNIWKFASTIFSNGCFPS